MSPKDKPDKPSTGPLRALTRQQPQLVPSGEFDDEDDNKTPITTDPLEKLEHRSRSTQRDTRSALVEMKEMRVIQLEQGQELKDIRDQITAYIETDQREHRRMSDGINALTRDIVGVQARNDMQTERMDNVVDKLGEVAEGQAAVASVTQLVLDELRGKRRVEEHREKVTIETQAVVQRTTVEDAADAKKAKRETNHKLLGLVSSSLGAGGTLTVIILAVLGKLDGC